LSEDQAVLAVKRKHTKTAEFPRIVARHIMSHEPMMDYQNWMSEFGLVTRFPRIGSRTIKVHIMRDNAIVNFLQRAKECRIVLTTNQKDKSIAIECRVECDSKLFDHVEKAGRSFVNAFYLALGRVKKNSYRAELRKVVAPLFAETWDAYIDAQYGRHPDPDVKKAYDDLRHAIAEELQETRTYDGAIKTNRGRKRGRKKAVAFDVTNRKKRYERILKATQHLHKMATLASKLSSEQTAKDPNLLPDTTDNRPLSRRKVIYEMSHGQIPREYHNWIFGGAAFKEIPAAENRNAPSVRLDRQMHEPRTWKPHQLAIALLKLDSGIDGISYKSLAREIRPTKVRQSL
jgi:hypothetical protein